MADEDWLQIRLLMVLQNPNSTTNLGIHNNNFRLEIETIILHLNHELFLVHCSLSRLYVLVCMYTQYDVV